MASSKEIKEQYEKDVDKFLLEHNFKITKDASFYWTNPTYDSMRKNGLEKIYFLVDEEDKAIAITTMAGERDIITYKDLRGCDLLINKESTSPTARGMVGGSLFGTPGLVVGAITAYHYVSSYRIIIYTGLLERPNIEFNMVSGRIPVTSPVLKSIDTFGQRVHATIKAITG